MLCLGFLEWEQERGLDGYAFERGAMHGKTTTFLIFIGALLMASCAIYVLSKGVSVGYQARFGPIVVKTWDSEHPPTEKELITISRDVLSAEGKLNSQMRQTAIDRNVSPSENASAERVRVRWVDASTGYSTVVVVERAGNKLNCQTFLEK